MPRLENWSIGSEFSNPYQAPELQVRKLYGEIYDDEFKRFEDGTRIVSSRLVELDLQNNIGQTRNTKYILGKPSEDYLKWLEENDISLEQFSKNQED